jgi:hypothetical protein
MDAHVRGRVERAGDVLRRADRRDRARHRLPKRYEPGNRLDQSAGGRGLHARRSQVAAQPREPDTQPGARPEPDGVPRQGPREHLREPDLDAGPGPRRRQRHDRRRHRSRWQLKDRLHEPEWRARHRQQLLPDARVLEDVSRTAAPVERRSAIQRLYAQRRLDHCRRRRRARHRSAERQACQGRLLRQRRQDGEGRQQRAPSTAGFSPPPRRT